MKHFFSYLLLIFLFPFGIKAQEKVYSWQLSAGVSQPVGEFSKTHFTGAMTRIEYAPRKVASPKSVAKNQWGWMLSSGLAYFPGRNRTFSSYPFRYGHFGCWHLSGGLLYQPVQKIRISLGAGPALSYYRKNLRFNIGAESGLSWNWNPRWGAGTTISCWKESGADPLWMIGLRGSYAF